MQQNELVKAMLYNELWEGDFGDKMKVCYRQIYKCLYLYLESNFAMTQIAIAIDCITKQILTDSNSSPERLSNQSLFLIKTHFHSDGKYPPQYWPMDCWGMVSEGVIFEISRK